MKVAIVYDRINKYGGAERVLEALHDIWPQAPVYSAVYDRSGGFWASGWDVRTSFLQHLPFASQHHELYPWLTQMAFESLDLREFEVVISVTSAEAKAVITHPDSLHVCYCLTPTRYLWSGYETYKSHPGLSVGSSLLALGLERMVSALRAWDLVAASRPDYYVAISRRVSGRIEKYYRRKPRAIIYPPVKSESFLHLSGRAPTGIKPGSYHLLVARLVGYKRIDLVVEAFTRLGWPLIIIGRGWQEKALKRQAGINIKFVTAYLTDEELVGYYRGARAFVYAGDEDFGIAPVEAMACGIPVIAFRNSAVSETVREGETGFLFAEQTTESLIKCVKSANQAKISSKDCEKQAMNFDVKLFTNKFNNMINELVESRRKKII